MPAPYIIYILSCQHKTLGPAFYVNGKIRCSLCHKDRSIRDVEVMEWRANCRKCNYSRWSGMSEANAEVLANGHVRRNPGHMVKVSREQHLEATKTKAKLDAWRILSES